MATRDSITGLPPGFQLDAQESDLPEGFQLDAQESDLPEGFQLDAQESDLPKTSVSDLPEGFQFESLVPEPQEDFGYVGNILAGAFERAATLGGSFLDAVQVIGEGLEEAIPLGGFVWDEGDILPSYKSPEEFARTEAPAILRKGAKILKDIDLGYQERTGWQDVKDAFDEGGIFSGSAYVDVLAYGVEQGIKSIPDMIAVTAAFPAYIMARSGEIGEQRAQNKGKDKADITDVLEAAPFAVASALLERIGAKGMTSDVKARLGGEIMKAGIKHAVKRVAIEGGRALVKEATTEAIQEGMIEYVGERYGTDVAMDFNEALDRAAGAAVAGGLFGGIVGGGTATLTEVTRPAAITEPPRAVAEPEITPTPTAEVASELETTQAEIAETVDTDDALAAAEKRIEHEIELHRQKEKTRLAETEARVAAEPLVKRPPVTPEQIKTDEERELAERPTTKDDITEPAVTPEQIQTEEEIQLSEEARIKSQAEIRGVEEARPAEALIDEVPAERGLVQDEVQELEALVETAPVIAELPKDIELGEAQESLVKLQDTFVKKYGDDYVSKLSPDETQSLRSLRDTVNDLTSAQETAGVSVPETKLSGTPARLKAFQSTLAEGVRADQAGFETFITDMKIKFGELGELSPKGTITNQKDFTQFIQAQTGQTIPLNEINLTRKIKGKNGKVQIVQVKADVVLRQTRKKRDLAVKLLRCIYG